MKKLIPIEIERDLKNSNLAIMRGEVQLAKTQFTNKELRQLMTALTYKSEGYIEDSVSEHQDYREDDDFIYVPNRFFLKRQNTVFKHFDFLDARYDKIYKKSTVKSNIELKEKQKKILGALLYAMKNVSETGILKAGTGIGKTVLMLDLFARAKRKTLILVHRESLMEQIFDSINKKGMISDVKLGVIKGNKIDVKGKDLVIGMIQTALLPKNKKHLEDFGLLMVDECERIASPKFIKAFKACPAKFKIGVSATPYRFDGGKDVMKNNFGNIIVDAEKMGIGGSPVHSNVIMISHQFMIYNNPGHEPDKPTTYFEDAVNNNIDRYNMLLSLVYHLANNSERKIVIMVSRVKHVKNLTNLLRSEGYPHVIGLSGGAPKSLVEKSKEPGPKIIISNKQYFSVGVDIQDLNTLIFFDFNNAGRNLIQRVGRIQRVDDGHERLVFDIVDLKSKLSVEIYKRKLYNYKMGAKALGVYYYKWNEIAQKINTSNYEKGDFINSKNRI